MSDDHPVPNPFAPPLAQVHDQRDDDATIELAEPGARLGAFVIDMLPGFAMLLVCVLALLPLLLPLFHAEDVKSEARRLMESSFVYLGSVGALFFAMCIGWTIYNIVLVYNYGQTFGKKVMAIRMVRTDGSRMSFARYFFLRCVAYGVLCAIPFIGWPIRLVDKLLIFRDSRQCLHDNIADTTVATAASSEHATLAASRMQSPRYR